MSINFFSLIDEDADVGDKEVMAAKLAMHSSFALIGKIQGKLAWSHILLPQQGKKKKEDCIWII